METKKITDIIGKWLTAASAFFAVAVMLCLLFIVIGEIIYPDERDEMDMQCELYAQEWYQLMDNGEKIPVTVPGKVEAERGETVTFVTNLPQELVNGDTICFRPIWQDVEIYLEGELKVKYDTADSRPFGTNSPFRYLFVELAEEDAGKELQYSFTSNSKYAGVTKEVYFGDRASIWFELIGNVGTKAVAALCLGIMGFFCLLVCLVLRFAYKKPLELRYLAWAIFLCAVWMLSEIEFRQLLIKNISVWTNITYWCLMLIAFPLLLYMNEIQKQRYCVVYALNIGYAGIVFVVGTVCQIFDISQFVSQVSLIHVGLVSSIVSVIATIVIDMMKKRMKEYMLVGIGVCGMLVSAVGEMALYYMEAGVSIGTVLAVGLMFLLVMAIIKTGNDLLQTEKNRQEAVLARDAQAKFLASMSHEIRTPINAVIGMNEMILRENEDEEIREYAQNIERASNMLLELVNDILDFSKIESGQLELVENTYKLGEVIQNEQLLLNTRIGTKPIEIIMEVDPRLPSKCYGDELRIKQILTNLLSNAAKYTQKGTITLKVFFQWINDEKISLCFQIKDTGVGIKKEDLPALFDEFKRLDLGKNRNVEGSGLGLNIVKQLVYLMQGNISVDSEYGKGSTFTVFIPQLVRDKTPIGDYAQYVEKCKQEDQASQCQFLAPNASILVVDDNAMNLTLMKALLKRTQMKVDTAKSGMGCLQKCKKKKYDMILMDHMMPEMDGVETLHRLRADLANPNKDTTVIALTANAIAGSREMYLGYGFDDYFSKPIEAVKLEALIMLYLPSELVYINDTVHKEEDVAEPVEKEGEKMVSNELLAIDRKLGLSYCMDMEEIYQEMLSEFCKQIESYLPQLDEFIAASDWESYATCAHAIKGNARSIGAVAFSDLSLQHEQAGKEGNEAFIKAEYSAYIAAMKALTDKIKNG